MIEGNILPPGTTYNIESEMNFIDTVGGVQRRWSYPKGATVTILKHKLWSEGAYRGVDYVVEMPDGYTLRESATTIHKILGLPPLKVKRKKK
jgi:hypothetical protein